MKEYETLYELWVVYNVGGDGLEYTRELHGAWETEESALARAKELINHPYAENIYINRVERLELKVFGIFTEFGETL